jgi:hypothetical protein
MKPLTKDILESLLPAIVFILILIFLPILLGKGCSEKVDPEPYLDVSDYELANDIADIQLRTLDVLLSHKNEYEKELGLK